MRELLHLLKEFDPASLESLAPRPLLMQGAGLMAAGDISRLSWSHQGKLEISFPQRLSILVHRLGTSEGRITGQCDCTQPYPCQHHIASLMLCLHVLKGFNEFGRFPNRMDLERFRSVLSDGDPTAATGMPQAPPPPPKVSKRHVLIQPCGPHLFGVRDPYAVKAHDGFGGLPPEAAGFCNPWVAPQAREEAFWKWFTSRSRTMEAYVEQEGSLTLVTPGSPEGWEGTSTLALDGNGLVFTRELSRNGSPVELGYVPLGPGLVFLPAERKLILLPAEQSWHSWTSLQESLQGSGSSFRLFPLRQSKNTGSLLSIPIPLDHWNNHSVIWWGGGENQSHHPALTWQGQKITHLEPCKPGTAIHLAPISDKRLVSVKLKADVAEISLTNDSIMHYEEVLASMSNDPSLVSSKGRREAVLAALFNCWLTEDAKARREILRTLEASPSFKTSAQAKRAVRVIKEVLKDEEENDPPLLMASPSQGWLAVTESTKTMQTLVALARGVLGIQWADEIPGYEPEDGEEGEMVALMEKVMPRLPLLVEACRQHGVDLRYNGAPVEVTTLHCKVSVQKAEGLDWFEMKPEVLGTSGLIPQEHWERMLTSGHYIDETGAMRILAAPSATSLRRLSETLGLQRGEAGRKLQPGDPFQIPRMRLLDWLLLSKHGIDCELPQSERQILESLLAFESLERQPLPASIKAKLRDYQAAGYSWLAFLYRHGFGACLADDMGLGKTLQTITLLAGIHEGTVKPLGEATGPRPHLLVVPPTLLFNWENEVRVFCPGLPVYEYTGKGRSLAGIREGIIITTYDIARRDIETLRDTAFDCLIFDEAQNVKNLTGERSKAMRQLQGRFKLVLTGTPLENHVGEYYSIIDLALPGLFGDYRFFMDALKQPNGIFNPLDRARPFVLRRTKDKILKELPPKVESDMHLELTEEQKRFYTRAVGEVRQEVLAAFQDKTAQQAGIVALAALTRLRQVCVSPALVDPEHTEVSPKLQYLIDKMEELRDEGHSALIFSQFTKALDLLQKHLQEAGIAFQRLDGSTPQQKRKELVEAFQSGKGPPVFLISLKAGGAGLNLTRASYVFHLDPWWNPAVESQASDRAHRMGQKSTVFIQRLLMRHTVEEKIMQLKAQKREIFDRVLSGAEGERATGAVITREDFKFLLE